MGENRKHTSQREDKELQFRHAEHLREFGILSLDVLRADKLREALERLYHVNEQVPIVVEGKRDVEALRMLGFSGEILTLHGRRGFYEFAEEIHERYGNIVLLLDWDEKGEALQSQMRALLPGLWEEHAPIRESLINLCQKDIRDVQSLPSLLDRLAGIRVLFPESAESRGDF
ncbi:MAG TPA: toprim domain-containing protein [Dissulfurispiraceae bacterium]|nr:toprim domain-containing protein [Dissulfurispiraceae bacterium]